MNIQERAGYCDHCRSNVLTRKIGNKPYLCTHCGQPSPYVVRNGERYNIGPGKGGGIVHNLAIFSAGVIVTMVIVTVVAGLQRPTMHVSNVSGSPTFQPNLNEGQTIRPNLSGGLWICLPEDFVSGACTKQSVITVDNYTQAYVGLVAPTAGGFPTDRGYVELDRASADGSYAHLTTHQLDLGTGVHNTSFSMSALMSGISPQHGEDYRITIMATDGPQLGQTDLQF